MKSSISSILRAATRTDSQPLSVLTFPCHERYQSGMEKVNAKFYLWQGSQGVKDWKSQYAKLPSNHVLLDPNKGDRQIPVDVDFDCILSHQKFGNYQVAAQLSRIFHLPLISLEHTLPMAQWGKQHLDQLKQMRGHVNLFISEYSRGKWGWLEEEADVIYHGVDTDLFCPSDKVEAKPHILSVCNDWINRDWCCNFQGWQRITAGLPTRVVGDTPGLSLPSKGVNDLVREYRESQVFLSTATVSPIPTVLLEAMSCGLACVSTATCMVPEIIENGVNGFISNDETKLREYCRILLNDRNLREEFGRHARQTILDKFPLAKFVDNWNRILRDASERTYLG